MSAYARCPRCRTADDLILSEGHEEWGTTDPGRHEVVGGLIIPGSVFYFEPGDPVRVEMECTRCGHMWRSRRRVGA